MKKLVFFFFILLVAAYGYAQKTAAVTFTHTYNFTDSLGRKSFGGGNEKDLLFADNHREIRINKAYLEKKVEWNSYCQEKFRNQTIVYDYDSVAIFTISNYDKTKERLYKKNLVDSSRWQVSDTSLRILKYNTKLATRKDAEGKIYRIYFTTALPNHKLRLGNTTIPGFVLKYEVERHFFKGIGLDIMTATDIDFYEEAIGFPSKYEIFINRY